MSKKKKRNLGRREFIKGLGLGAAGVAIPFFNSSVALGQSATAPVRVLLVSLQHGWGVDSNYGTFSGTGTNFTIPTPLAAFEQIRNQCVFVDGLRTSFWGNAHDVSYQDIFTCSVPYGTPGSSQLGTHFPLPTSASLDYLIGQHHNKEVLRLSHDYKSWGAPHHYLSFDNNVRQQPFHTNTREAYNSFVPGIMAGQQNSPPTNTTANSANQSLFTFLGRDTNRLLAKVSGTERVKLEEYLSALNNLGNGILSSGNGGGGGIGGTVNVPLPDIPGMSQSFSDDMDSYLEMIRVAFAYDTHRVAVLGLGEGPDNWSWQDSNGATQSGNTTGGSLHHEIAHYNGKAADRKLSYNGWVNWYAQKMVQLVNSLQNTTDVDGNSLLDNTVIVLTGEVANGAHNRHDSLHTVIGGGGNQINRGRWLQTEKVGLNNPNGVFIGSRDPNGNNVSPTNIGRKNYSRHHASDLWVSIARLAGLNINSFGFDIYNHAPIQL